jgi:hypothetical protein
MASGGWAGGTAGVGRACGEQGGGEAGEEREEWAHGVSLGKGCYLVTRLMVMGSRFGRV